MSFGCGHTLVRGRGDKVDVRDAEEVRMWANWPVWNGTSPIGLNKARTVDCLAPVTVPLSTPLMTIRVPLGTGTSPSTSFTINVMLNGGCRDGGFPSRQCRNLEITQAKE